VVTSHSCSSVLWVAAEFTLVFMINKETGIGRCESLNEDPVQYIYSEQKRLYTGCFFVFSIIYNEILI